MSSSQLQQNIPDLVPQHTQSSGNLSTQNANKNEIVDITPKVENGSESGIIIRGLTPGGNSGILNGGAVLERQLSTATLPDVKQHSFIALGREDTNSFNYRRTPSFYARNNDISDIYTVSINN